MRDDQCETTSAVTNRLNAPVRKYWGNNKTLENYSHIITVTNDKLATLVSWHRSIYSFIDLFKGMFNTFFNTYIDV